MNSNEPPEFPNYSRLERFLIILNSNVQECNRVNFLIDLRPLHIWALTLANECFVDRPHFSLKRSKIILELKKLFQNINNAFMNFYPECVTNYQRFENVYTSDNLLEMLSALHDKLQNRFFYAEFDSLLYNLLNCYISLIAMFQKYEINFSASLLVISRIILIRMKDHGNTCENWPDLVEKISTLSIVFKLIKNTLQKKFINAHVDENELFIFIFSIGLKGYSENESSLKFNIFFVIAQKTFMTFQKLKLLKKNFYKAFCNKTVCFNMISYFQDNFYSKFTEYLNYIFTMFQESFKIRNAFIHQRIMPVIILKHDLSVSSNFFHSFCPSLSQSGNWLKIIECIFIPVFIDLFFRYNAELDYILSTIDRFEQICGLNCLFEQLKQDHIQQVLIQNILMNFPENPLGGLRAFSFAHTITYLESITEMRETHLNLFKNSKKFTVFLTGKNNYWLRKLNIFDETTCHRICPVLFHLLRFVIKQQFIQDNMLEILSILRVIICSKKIIFPTNEFFASHILKLLVKYYPLSDLKYEASIISRMASTLYTRCPMICVEIYHFLLSVDQDNLTEIMNTIILLPYEGELKERIVKHSIQYDYEFVPFELISRRTIQQSNCDTDKFEHVCKYMIHLSMHFDNEDELIQSEALQKFLDLWEDNVSHFTKYTIYHYRERSLEGDTNFNLKFPFHPTFKLDKWWKFFRFIILQLLKTIKFSKYHNAAASALGHIGAVNPQKFHLNEPFLRKNYDSLSDSFSDYYPELLEFSNISIFRPQTQMFKQIFLKLVLRRIFFFNACSFNDASFALRKLFIHFQEFKQLKIFGDIYSNTKSQDFSIQKLLEYCKNNYKKEQREEMRTLIIATLYYEKNECLKDLSMFKPHELKFLKKPFNDFVCSRRFNSFQRGSKNAHEFFNSISSNMTYQQFILDFIQMLYHEYVFNSKSNNAIISPNLVFSQVITQLSQRREQVAYMNNISQKLHSLEMNIEMFELAYPLAVHDVQLAHLLIPSLIVFALSQVSEDRKIEFAEYFSNMIRKDFIDNRTIFTRQLGVMASQFIFLLFDFFQDFLFNRCRLHDILIRDTYIKNKVNQYDSTFCALNHILNRVSYLDMSRLCLRLKSFTRALYYFEKFFEQNNSRQVTFEVLSHDELMLLLQIFYQLEDKHSLRGMNIQMKYFPDMLQKFYFSANNVEKSSQMILAQNILNISNISISERYLIQEFLAKNSSSRCFSKDSFSAFSRQVFQELSLESDNLSSIWSSEVPSLICDAALDLNSWEILDEAFSSQCVKPFIENRIPQVIKSLHDGTSVDRISEELKQIQNFYLQPLRSELLNSHFNAFENAYRSIVYLHSISDLESFVNESYVNVLDETQELNSILRTFDELTRHWYARNKKVPYVYDFNQIKFDIKQQILRVQMMLLNVFKVLIEKRFSNDCLLKPFFLKHNFLFYSELMRASMEQENTQDAYHHYLSAYNARSQFYIHAKPGESISNSTAESHFIVEASNILYQRNDKEGALDLVKKEIAERYSELNKKLANEVFERIEETEKDYNKINEIALELNLTLPERYGMLFNIWRTSKLDNCESSRKSTSRTRRMEVNQFRENRNQFRKDIDKNYELLKLQFMVLAEESGALSLQAMKFCSDQIHLLTENGSRSQARNFLHMALYNWRYVQTQDESKVKLKKDDKNQVFKLREEIIISILNSLNICEKDFKVAIPIMLSTWRLMGNNDIFKADSEINDKNSLYMIYENCCEKLVEFAETGPSQVFLNQVDLIVTLFNSKVKPLISITCKRILISLICQFPFHMNWNLQRFISSKYKDNVNVPQLFMEAKSKIPNQENNSSNHLSVIRGHFSKFIQLLIDFCELRFPVYVRRNKLCLSEHAQGLWYQFPKYKKDFPIILPFDSFLNIGFYNLLRVHDIENFGHLFIDSLENNFKVMTSVQCPKVITVLCKDGIKRSILLKNGDDLRKDKLFMDFARLFNQAQDGELSIFQPLKMYAPSGHSERKRSSIRFYSVVPLSTESGIIEWIPNLSSFNSLIYTQKEIIGKYQDFKNLQAGYEAKVRDIVCAETRMKAFSLIVQNSAPVFQNWFINNFANAHSWYTARQNYILSSAAYSAVGFIMGLGDRHGENIQLDITTGNSVHIDFNCIFNYGESFQVPELVPFRLTQNMLAAMGVTKHVGEFSGEFAEIISTLREYKSLIMILFLPIQFDPFEEWIKFARRYGETNKSVRLLSLMNQHLNGVRSRLSGLCKRNNGEHYGSILSPIAQTNYLINQAIDEKNLALMFHGWRAYN